MVPWPGLLVTRMPPLCPRKIPWTAAKPNPRPVNFVVKKGSNIFASVCSSMPQPVGGTFHGFLDYVNVLACRFGRWQLQLDKISVAHDPGQDVVEVVGDSPGQDAKAFEFLGVEQSAFHVQLLLLGPFSVGDVPHDYLAC